MKHALSVGHHHRMITAYSWRGTGDDPHWLTVLQMRSRLSGMGQFPTITPLAEPDLLMWFQMLFTVSHHICSLPWRFLFSFLESGR